jgi:hypothetical protein
MVRFVSLGRSPIRKGGLSGSLFDGARVASWCRLVVNYTRELIAGWVAIEPQKRVMSQANLLAPSTNRCWRYQAGRMAVRAHANRPTTLNIGNQLVFSIDVRMGTDLGSAGPISGSITMRS